MSEQYTIHKLTKEIPPKAEQVPVGPKTNGTLPDSVGYDKEQFVSDIMGAFQDCEVADTEEVKRTWKNHALYKNDHRSRFVGFEEAERGAEATAEFFKQFKESKFRDILLKDFCDGDVDKATRTFLDWAEYHFVPGQEMDKQMEGLAQAMQNAKEGIEGMPVPGGKSGDGDKKMPLTPQQMRIAEILPKVRRNYEFVGNVTNKYEETFYPEDDIEWRTMNSYAELARVPFKEMVQEDELFYHKLVHKTLPVAQYLRAIPMPANFTVLLDVSGSMRQGLQNGYLRSEYATAVCIAVCEKALESGVNTVTLIYFDGGAHTPITGDAAQIVKELWKCQFSGGNTNFEAAFRAADKTDNAAVIIITDCGGGFSTPPKAPLHTLQVGQDGDGGAALGRVSIRMTRVI